MKVKTYPQHFANVQRIRMLLQSDKTKVTEKSVEPQITVFFNIGPVKTSTRENVGRKPYEPPGNHQ